MSSQINPSSKAPAPTPAPSYVSDKIGLGLGLTLGMSGVAYKLMSNQNSNMGTFGALSTVAISAIGILGLKNHLGYREMTHEIKPLPSAKEIVKDLSEEEIETAEKIVEKQSITLSENQKTISSLTGSYAQLKSIHDELTTQHKNLQQQFCTLETSHQTLQQEFTALATEHNTLKQDFETLEDDFAQLEKDFDNAQDTLDKKSDENDLLKEELIYKQQMIDSSQSHIDYISQLMDEFETATDPDKQANYLQQMKSAVSTLKAQTPAGSSVSSTSSTPSKSSRTLLVRTQPPTPRKNKDNNLKDAFDNA
ncbi:MAG: hypothetical protein QRY72_02570 [Candidatus Rhabdochlamydia sp.]